MTKELGRAIRKNVKCEVRQLHRRLVKAKIPIQIRPNEVVEGLPPLKKECADSHILARTAAQDAEKVWNDDPTRLNRPVVGRDGLPKPEAVHPPRNLKGRHSLNEAP